MSMAEERKPPTIVLDSSVREADWNKYVGDGESREYEEWFGVSAQTAGRLPAKTPPKTGQAARIAAKLAKAETAESKRHLSGQHNQKSHGRKGGGEGKQEALFSPDLVADQGGYGAVFLSDNNPKVLDLNESEGAYGQQGEWRRRNGEPPREYREYEEGHWAKARTPDGDIIFVNGLIAVQITADMTPEQQAQVLRDFDVAGGYRTGFGGAPGKFNRFDTEDSPIEGWVPTRYQVADFGVGSLDVASRQANQGDEQFGYLTFNARLWKDDGFAEGLGRSWTEAAGVETYKMDVHGFDGIRFGPVKGQAGGWHPQPPQYPSATASRAFAMNLATAYRATHDPRNYGESAMENWLVDKAGQGQIDTDKTVEMGGTWTKPESKLARSGPDGWDTELTAGTFTTESLGRAYEQGKIEASDLWQPTAYTVAFSEDRYGIVLRDEWQRENEDPVDIEATRHFPGKHDQKSHGRKGGGGDPSNLSAAAVATIQRGAHEGGISYHAVDDWQPKSGVMVSTYPKRSVKADRPTKADIRKFARDNADLLTKRDHFIGAWRDSKSGALFLDVAVRVGTVAESKALNESTHANQIAAYDITHKHEVPLGGTGE